MAISTGNRGGLNSEINVTPLVDVMLVLLIIMMLIAPMLQKGVPVTLPLADNTIQKPETQDQTVLAVDRSNKFYVNSIEVPRASMADRVKAALDDLRKVGIEDIGLITDPKTRQPTTTGGK